MRKIGQRVRIRYLTKQDGPFVVGVVVAETPARLFVKNDEGQIMAFDPKEIVVEENV